ncbi:MAG TPA: hypothetical protein VKG25_28685 [Bryobacteraceae bacterium]|nr:hypothetical protein [Bryobacteraceae bacterium]
MEQLFDLALVIEQMFASAGLEYRVVGGLATYLYIEENAPDAGRLTRDIDIAVRREDLDTIAAVARRFGMEYRHVAGPGYGLCHVGPRRPTIGPARGPFRVHGREGSAAIF